MLTDAARHLDDGAWEDALQALLAAWREVRAPELEALIEAFSAWVGAGVPPLDPGDDAFHARVRLGRAIDLPVLLDGVFALPVGTLPARIYALLDRPADPRMGPVLLRAIETPPTTASANFGMWSRIFAALPSLVDQRAQQRLEARAAAPGGASQFWPKLARWIAVAVDKLPPTAALPSDAAPEIRRLHEQIDALDTVAVPAFAAEAEPAFHAPGDLPAALEALRAGDLEASLDALVGAWGTCRAPALGDLIERLGLLVDARRPALPRTPPDALQRAWVAAAAAPRPSEVGPLLAAWRDGKWAQVEVRMTCMRGWAPDPRVCRAMLALTRDVMVGARRQVWSTAFDLLVHHADPRLADDVLALHARLQGPRALHRRAAMGREADRVIDAFRAEVSRPSVLPAADEAALAALVHAVDRLAVRPPDANDRVAQGLMDAIVAAPDDDGPRLVYADWLRERDDVRGAFIALDVALARGERVKGKRDKLLAAHREAVLGPMALLLEPTSRIERGFVFEAQVRLRHGVLEVPEDQRLAMLNDPGWRTVRTLHCWEDPSEILRHAPLDSLREVGRVSLDGALALVERTSPLQVEVMTFTAADGEPGEKWARLGALVPVLPALRDLEVLFWRKSGGRAVPPTEFFATPLVARLERLTSGRDGGTGGTCALGAWLGPLVAAGSKVPRVELSGQGVTVALVREDDGRYAVTLTAPGVRFPRQAQEVARWVDDVDPAHVSTATWTIDGDADVVAALRAELDQRLPA